MSEHSIRHSISQALTVGKGIEPDFMCKSYGDVPMAPFHFAHELIIMFDRRMMHQFHGRGYLTVLQVPVGMARS